MIFGPEVEKATYLSAQDKGFLSAIFGTQKSKFHHRKTQYSEFRKLIKIRCVEQSKIQ